MKLRNILLSAVAAFFGAVLAVQAQVPNVSSTLNSVFTLGYEVSTSKPTYSASWSMAMTATAPTDVCSLQGSATKTLRLRRILLSGAATAVESNTIGIVKRSTINSAASGAQMNIISYDSADAVSGATVEFWTGTPPTLGTLVGYLTERTVTFPNATTGIGTGEAAIEFGKFASPVFIRGITQAVSVNLSGVNFNTGTLLCTFEWTEDNDS